MTQFVNPHTQKSYYLFEEKRVRAEKNKHLAKIIYWFSQDKDYTANGRTFRIIDKIPDGFTIKWPNPIGHGSKNRMPVLCKAEPVVAAE